MDEDELNHRLRELINEAIGLRKNQQKQLSPLVEETTHQHTDIKENTNKITKSLRDLRVCIKYLLFDLEATRRERDSLKKQLNDKPD